MGTVSIGEGGFRDPSSGVTLLIDGDIIAFQAASVTDGRCYTVRGSNFKYKADAVSYAAEKGIPSSDITLQFYPDPVNVAYAVTNQIVDEIIKEFTVDKIKEVKVFLSGEENFRRKYLPFYKISRKPAKNILEFFEGDMDRLCSVLGTTPATFQKRLEDPLDARRPEHLPAVGAYLKSKWGAESEEGLEADDMIGIAMGECDRGIIVTTDKDLNTIPGPHCNLSTRVRFDVSPEEALLNFYAQCLSGDKTDTIPGLYGYGEATAKKALKGCVKPKDLWAEVKRLWALSHPDLSVVQATTKAMNSAACVFIMQERGKEWHPPIQRRR